MPAIGVQHCLIDLQRSISDSLALTTDAREYRLRRPDGTYRYIGVRKVELIAGLALLRIHIAWEDFLQDTFTRYMCGATSASGYRPASLSPAYERSIADARRKLLGPKSRYLDWNPQNTLNWAAKHFNLGEPFTTAIGSIRLTLDDLAAVRNRFAHRSEYAILRFNAVVRNALGYMPSGMTVGRFLLTADPAAIGGTQIFIESYATALLSAANAIVP